MANFISTSANRFYAVAEPAFGYPALPSGVNRFPAMRVSAQQEVQKVRRLDKTGTRTFQGVSPLSRRQTSFDVTTYLAKWNGSGEPGYGPLFRAALGSAGKLTYGQIIQTVAGPLQLSTAQPHGLQSGSAVALRNEIRFVSAVLDPVTICLNAPFTQPAFPGDIFSPAITYRLATTLPSLTVYDYWDPITTASRAIRGAVVNQMNIDINGDYHRFAFSGPAADVLDSVTYQAGQTVWTNFPSEPAIAPFDASGVPGHLGQAWIGNSAAPFMTLTHAQIRLSNQISMRSNDFGSSYPQSFAAGLREVTTNISVLATDANQTLDLYRAARNRTPLPLMLQLGVQSGQLAGIYLPNQVLEMPSFDESDARLEWNFQNNFAQGSADDELYLAFA